MKKKPLSLSCSSLLSTLVVLPVLSRAATLVDLSATTLPLGPITSWTNSGTIGGAFTATGAPVVQNISGYRTVRLPGAASYFTGPAMDAAVTGVNKPVTVEVWSHNPNIPGEETLVAWGRRGGGNGTNASYNYGNDARWGAVGHWGGEDIGWIDQDVTVGAPAANQWHYLVWTYDGVTERLYSDGVAMHFENKNLNVWATNSGGAPLPIRLGAQNNADGTVALFNDGISILRVRVKDTVMTPTEITDNYTTEKAALDATIVASVDSFTANRTQFLPGEGVTLTWATTNATTSVEIDNGGGTGLAASGSVTVNPTVQTTYTISATNANGNATSSITVRPYSRPLNVNRWSFNEASGTTVIDSVSAKNGQILGPAGTPAAGNGLWDRTASEVRLGGGGSGTSSYIDLPNQLISVYPEVTLEGWMTINSNQNWGRVFDFGTNNVGEIFAPGGGFSGNNYLVLTSQVGGDQNFKRLELLPGGGTLDINDPVSQGTQFHFALTYDATGNAGTPRMNYYVNGVLKGALNTSVPLSAIADVNNWLGRSNWSGDNNTDGAYNEFRIWSGALRAEDIQQSYTNGPDATTLPPTVPPLISAFVSSQQAYAPGESVNLTWNITGAVTSASIDQGIGTVAASGTTTVMPTAPTTYTLTATNTYGTTTKTVSLRPVHLSHRWSFNESEGAFAKDSLGGTDAYIYGSEGAVVSGNGLWTRDGRKVRLGGGDSHTAAYVDLPNALLSPLTDATLEGWATINGSQNWSRIFDFGNGQSGELFGPGGDAGGIDNFLFAAQVGGDQNVKRVEYNNGGGIMDVVDPPVLGEQFHFAVVYDSKGNNGLSPRITYYRNGTVIGTLNTGRPLSTLQDVNNFLGRSNWTGDANLDGGFDEFRIWDTPLSATQVSASVAAGPDALPFAPPAQGAPALISSTWTPGGGGVSISWASVAGRSYIVEYSTDLVTWVAARNLEGDALIAPAATATSSADVVLPPSITQRVYLRARDISTP